MKAGAAATRDCCYPPIKADHRQNALNSGANRQIDLAIRTGNMVPKPPNIPGVRR
jgi:hypothetical protein